MALSYPLALSVLSDLLPISTLKWRLRDNQEISGLGSGQILAAELAPSLWEAEITLDLRDNGQTDAIQARLEALDGSIRPFYLVDPKRRFPQSDPDGSILGGATPSIRQLGSNNRSLSLQGLPEGYRVTVGDLLSFDYGAPARRALHRVVETVTATSAGNTSLFEVRPHVRLGAAIGDAVALIKPSMKCILQPGSLDASTTGRVQSQISFSVIQKL